MKKKLIFKIVITIVIGVCAYIGIEKNSSLKTISDIVLGECESLAGCEIYDSHMNLIVECKGNSEVCWEEGYIVCHGERLKH